MADCRIGAGGIKISIGDLCTGKSRENNPRNPTMMTVCQRNTETNQDHSQRSKLEQLEQRNKFSVGL